ncbi:MULTISPECIES: hypothetical protein [Sphingopyxis]|uniref:hypothetical protein n=1 Tax=Sphingopyxis TaxID=165697 RepID=UPI001933C7B2|nr:hypothetical protein [Sphingopyxis terrae]
MKSVTWFRAIAVVGGRAGQAHRVGGRRVGGHADPRERLGQPGFGRVTIGNRGAAACVA